MFIFLVACLFFASCVSKKKYESLTRAKRSADREIASLLGDREALEEKVKRLQAEFNTARYKLTENNAAKEKQIDEFHARLRVQESQGSALKTELQDAEEQARYAEQTHKQRVAGLEERLRTVVSERDEARGQLNDLKASLEQANRKLKTDTERLSSDLAARDARVEELNKEIKATKDMLSAARKTLESKDQELQKLIRQVEALKK
jgi:chromosome segregation ATPase